MPIPENPFQRKVLPKLRSDTLSPTQETRLKKYLDFDLPPGPTDSPEAIIVMGTSPLGDSKSFYMRLGSAIQYSNKFPNASVIFTGHRPDSTRAASAEMEPDWIESEIMRDIAIRGGLNAKQIRVETNSVNTKENIFNSLKMLSEQIKNKKINSVLVIGSNYTGRRINFYILKALLELGLNEFGIEYFIHDCDVEEDKDSLRKFTDEELRRKRDCIRHEWERLPEYRKKGDL